MLLEEMQTHIHRPTQWESNGISLGSDPNAFIFVCPIPNERCGSTSLFPSSLSCTHLAPLEAQKHLLIVNEGVQPQTELPNAICPTDRSLNTLLPPRVSSRTAPYSSNMISNAAEHWPYKTTEGDLRLRVFFVCVKIKDCKKIWM